MLFYFSCEYQLLGRQRLLVILPVSIIEGTGFCESLGKNYNIIACSLGSSPSCSLLSDSSCQHPSSAQRPCRWAPESLQGLGASVTPSPPNFMVREEHLRHQGPEEIHQQSPSTPLRVPGCAAQARGLWLLVKVISLSRGGRRWTCTSVIFF